jgi:hypothetical protein
MPGAGEQAGGIEWPLLTPANCSMLWGTMNWPINMQESIGKTVGRRTTLRNPFDYALGLQETASELYKLTGRGLCPKGVFKFKSHEEADAWTRKMLARPPVKKA